MKMSKNNQETKTINLANIIDDETHSFEELLRKGISEYNEYHQDKPMGLKDIARIVDNFTKVSRAALNETPYDVTVSASGTADISKVPDDDVEWVINRYKEEMGGNGVRIFLMLHKSLEHTR